MMKTRSKRLMTLSWKNENRNENISTVPKGKVSKKQPDVEAQKEKN